MAAYGDILAAIEDVVALIRSWAARSMKRPSGLLTNLDNAILNPQGSEPTFALRERFVPADKSGGNGHGTTHGVVRHASAW